MSIDTLFCQGAERDSHLSADRPLVPPACQKKKKEKLKAGLSVK